MKHKQESIIVKPKPLFAVFSPIKYLIILIFILGASVFIKPYVPMEYLKYFTLGASGILLVIYLLNYFFIRSIKYTITEEQIIFTRGIFTITTDFIELYRVVDSKIIRSFLLRFIGGMSYHIDTLDKSHPIFILKGIPKSQIDSYVRQLVEKARLKKRVFITE